MSIIKRTIAVASTVICCIGNEVPAAHAKSNYQICVESRAELIKYNIPIPAGSYECDKLADYKSPAQRVAAAGGRTALIRKCEALHKPTLKDPRSYRYDKANIVAKKSKLIVKVDYRAKNSFNAVIPGTFSCTFNG